MKYKLSRVIEFPYAIKCSLFRKGKYLLLPFIISTHCDAEMFYYYIPFRIQTYTPITKNEIMLLAKKHGMQSVLSQNHEKTLALLTLHKTQHCLFDDKNVRIYIRNNQMDYFIDNKGIAQLSHNKINECSIKKIDENEIMFLLKNGGKDNWDKDER